MSRIKAVLGTRRRKVAASVATGVMMVAGGAFAYELATATTQTFNSTAGAAPVAVAITAHDGITGGPLYPNSGSESQSFYVQNTNVAPVGPVALTASIPADGNGFALDVNGNGISGCLASWFVPTSSSSSSADGTFQEVTVGVTMSDPNVNQNACAGKTVQVALTAAAPSIG